MQVWQSAVGRKLIMALTGILMVLFLCAHVLGNMAFHFGPDAINAYAAHLKSLPPLLWLERAAMLAALAVHIWFGITLTLENYRSRPVNYTYRKYLTATFSSRTMIFTGLAILAFIIYHLLHFTVKVTSPENYYTIGPEGHLDVYKMAGLSFAHPFITIVYIIALAAVLLHIWHGIASFFQTFGWNNDTTRPVVERASYTASVLIFLLFISIPLSFLLLGGV